MRNHVLCVAQHEEAMCSIFHGDYPSLARKVSNTKASIGLKYAARQPAGI